MSLAEARFALRHPKIALSYLRMKKKIAALTRTDVEEVTRYFNEPSLKVISNRVATVLHGYEHMILGAGKRPRKAVAYYAICRITKPAIVVETGVQSGVSSAFILQALRDNHKGLLYSIDLPDQDLLKAIPSHIRMGKQSGWIVPPELDENWVLITGKSQDNLSSLLKKIEVIDIFIHDSEHSFDNMYAEYEEAWQFLRSGGVLLSDDVHLNNAFHDFTSKVHVHPTMILHSVAAVTKP